jgi:anaerobic dimethyl sulfoxide reductase subunit B (iron-sulfur subunit)
MVGKALLIDYEYCTGCQTCMMACQVEKQLPIGRFGIVVNTIGPWKIDEQVDTWQYDYIPTLTDECDLCARRTEKGKLPSCVMHCQAAVMSIGSIAEMADKLSRKDKQILQVPKNKSVSA